MAKQVRLKFKKLLKKAEFVHADLEYHEELLPEAKQEFMAHVNEIFQALPLDEKKKINEQREKSLKEETERLEREAEESQEGDKEEEAEEEEISHTPDKGDELDDLPEIENPDVSPVKGSELKKLYYKVADKTHPDKVIARGASETEAKRLEKMFMSAQAAYKNANWYLLYSLAMDLDIEVADPTKETLRWLEEDIKGTMSKISNVAGLIIWAWYVGSDTVKDQALKSYFLQAYDYKLESTSID